MAGDIAAFAELGVARLKSDLVRLDKIDRYLTGTHDQPYTPRSATAEYQLLAQRAVSNWLPLLVKTPCQALAVEGYRRTGVGDFNLSSSAEWQVWQQNRMDARQTAVHRAALSYGYSYVTVMPSQVDPDGVVLRGVSPRRMWAWYDDAASDALPLWAVEVSGPIAADGDETRVWFYDAESVTELMVGAKTGPRVVGQPRAHGMGVCPVVRFAADLDLEGRATGVVWPMIAVQDRINQTVFDLLVSQTFGSFKVRTISGMAPEFVVDADGLPVMDGSTGKPKVIPIQADASRFLVAPDADTRFQQLDETPLGGFIDAVESAAKHLAAVSQTPPHYMLGSTVNLSAEALAAAESALTRAVDEYRHMFGEAWELVLALVATARGLEADEHAQVLWKDTGSRSMSQTVDALGKAVQMLDVPARAMWSRIPGTTASDIESWAQIAAEDDPVQALATTIGKIGPPSAP